ncbi:MAG: hypothetical protein KGH79_02685 [Patescibacteria group bacterium]|nr:hypothetical protein [Patescibacteria group bacterium]
MSSDNDAKLKHLEFIQATINRMAGNSFLLKGWTVTLVGALFAAAVTETSFLFLGISLCVVLFFWLLDGYYLSRERHFVKLYEHVSVKKPADIDFSMRTKLFRTRWDWPKCSFSTTLVVFYGGLVVLHLILIYYL